MNPGFYLHCNIDPSGGGMDIIIRSLSGPMHISQYLEIVMGWVSVAKKKYEREIKEFEECKTSKKVVSITSWKKDTK